MSSQENQDNQSPDNTVQLSQLAAELLSKRLIDAINQVTLKKSLDTHILIELGSTRIELQVSLPRKLVAISLLIFLIWMFPDLWPLLPPILQEIGADA